jgi:hypothetical protein
VYISKTFIYMGVIALGLLIAVLMNVEAGKNLPATEFGAPEPEARSSAGKASPARPGIPNAIAPAPDERVDAGGTETVQSAADATAEPEARDGL